MTLRIAALAFALLLPCAPAHARPRHPSHARAAPRTLRAPQLAPVVASFDTLGVERLNAEIAAAVAARQAWSRDPVQVALHDRFRGAGAAGERPEMVLSWKGDPPGKAASGEVVIVQQGLLDDSIAAEWDRYQVARQADGSWRVTAHHHAQRCRRGEASETTRFHRGVCL